MTKLTFYWQSLTFLFQGSRHFSTSLPNRYGFGLNGTSRANPNIQRDWSRPYRTSLPGKSLPYACVAQRQIHQALPETYHIFPRQFIPGNNLWVSKALLPESSRNMSSPVKSFREITSLCLCGSVALLEEFSLDMSFTDKSSWEASWQFIWKLWFLKTWFCKSYKGTTYTLAPINL